MAGCCGGSVLVGAGGRLRARLPLFAAPPSSRAWGWRVRGSPVLGRLLPRVKFSCSHPPSSQVGRLAWGEVRPTRDRSGRGLPEVGRGRSHPSGEGWLSCQEVWQAGRSSPPKPPPMWALRHPEGQQVEVTQAEAWPSGAQVSLGTGPRMIRRPPAAVRENKRGDRWQKRGVGGWRCKRKRTQSVRAVCAPTTPFLPGDEVSPGRNTTTPQVLLHRP